MGKLFKNKNLAFTLAEVLITLGIIGVVVMMTIPTLKDQIEQQQNIVAWKKAYSTIDNAQRQIMNDNGGDLSLGFSNIGNLTGICSNNFRDGWIPYFKVTKKCDAGKSVTNGCYTGTMKALTDDYTTADYASSGAVSSIVLQDGTVLFFYPGVCGGVFCPDSHIFIDVNGSKLPNRFGKDLFKINYSTTKKLFLPRIISNPTCSGDGTFCGTYYLMH